MRHLLVAALIVGLGIGSAYASGFMLLHVGQADGSGAAPGCVSPTAPDGVIDLSECSNAFYAAVVF